MKRFIITTLLMGGILISLSAQAAITRFAVVDMNRVMAAFAEQSTEFKAFSDKRNTVQAEIEKQAKELQELNTKLAEAQEEGKKDQIRTLENQIRTKTQAAKNYYDRMIAELEKDRQQLQKNNTFMARVNNAIRVVAESEGFSMVLSRETAGILWYSPSVDITNKVIARIRS
ncbi:MAG: OmpH family outer membrane protein [Treponema sp.]|nr:OmpH family outer membrane protein [Treponema sp.]